MGRRAEGWKLVWRIGVSYVRQHADGAVAYVRFTYKGSPFLLSTGERDPRKAPAACGRIYADVLQRGAPKASGVALGREPLADLFTRWLATLDGVLDKTTASTYEGYARKHFLAGFEDINETADLGRVRAYINQRLRNGLKKSILKELSALRGFLTWCRDEKIFGEIPAWVELRSRSLFPAKATGRRVGKQRAVPVNLTLEQVQAILVALPEVSERTRKGRPHAVQPRFVFAYETGLRPSTLDEALWSDIVTDRDGTWFVIRDEIDKNRYGRRVPVTDVANAALERVARRSDGLIFGKHDYRGAIKKACRLAGVALKVAPYDLRHARGTHDADAGAPLTVIAYRLGHLQVSTSNRYVHASDKTTAAWVAAKSLAAKVPPALPQASAETSTNPEVSRTVSEHDEAENSAKEGSRTPTRVTPLEPESDGSYGTSEKQDVSIGRHRHDAAANGLDGRNIRTVCGNSGEPWVGVAAARIAARNVRPDVAFRAASWFASEWVGGVA